MRGNRLKISVIVPVFNSEKYVGRCIDSIIAQTYSNWEAILVDDGSKDNSLSILHKYEKNEHRIKVIHQANSGPGIARNTGIKKATGDYIVFVDSDDVIKPNYFKKLSKEKADVIFIDIDQVDEKFNVIRKEYMSIYRTLPKDDFLRNQMTGKIQWGGVRKAVKSEFLQKRNITFSEHRIGEEAIYSFMLMHYAESFSFIKGPVYTYVNHAGSQSDTKEDDPWGDVVSSLKNRVIQLNLYQQYADTINSFWVTAAVVSLDKMAKKYSYDVYSVKAREYIKKFSNEVDKNFAIDFKHLQDRVIILYPFFKSGWVLPVYYLSHLNSIIKSMKI